MDNYMNKQIVKAVQWFKMGDHPYVHFFTIDERTGKNLYNLDNGRAIWRQPRVHPGNYIVEFPNGTVKYMGKKYFEERYKKVPISKKRKGAH